MTAARAAVHVVNIKPSTFNYHLFLYGGSAVGKRHHHRRRPPSRRAVFPTHHHTTRKQAEFALNSAVSSSFVVA